MIFITGWWFGCHEFYCPILGISSSQLTNSIIFQRGFSPTTNQSSIPSISPPCPQSYAPLPCQDRDFKLVTSQKVTKNPGETPREHPRSFHTRSGGFLWKRSRSLFGHFLVMSLKLFTEKSPLPRVQKVVHLRFRPWIPLDPLDPLDLDWLVSGSEHQFYFPINIGNNHPN